MDLLLMDAYSLAFDLPFADLGADAGLARLDRLFLTALADDDAALAGRLLAARATPDALDAKAEGELIVDLGASLEAFLAGLFGVEAEIAAIAGRTAALDPIHACKRLFVQRQAVRKYPAPQEFDGPALRASLEAAMAEPLTEAAFAAHVAAWEAAANASLLDTPRRYAAWA